MAFIETIAEDDATGEIAAAYDAHREAFGYVPDYAKVFMSRPAVYAGWRALIEAIMANMDRRRYELATLAAAQQLRSSYCSLAHGKVLRKRFFAADELVSIVRDRHAAALDEVEVAVMDFAEQVADDAFEISGEHIQRLRDLGMADEEIADVVFAAAARSFFAKVLDALGAQPDAVYRELEPQLQDALAVGRPIATGD